MATSAPGLIPAAAVCARLSSAALNPAAFNSAALNPAACNSAALNPAAFNSAKLQPKFFLIVSAETPEACACAKAAGLQFVIPTKD